jgi:NTE family protein
MNTLTTQAPSIGLVMSGGGARAAYQAGVLRAVASMLPRRSPNPFRIICGTSAGAINAAGLACKAEHFDRAVLHLVRAWSRLHIREVYRSNLQRACAHALQSVIALLVGREHRTRPLALLDCSPLHSLLDGLIDFTGIRRSIESGHLGALCVTAASYTSGDSVSFFEGEDELQPWQRSRRVGRRARIGLEHVLASCALPFAFPPVRVGSEHFGDGSMHQLAPISAALHLGADRVFVIGVGSPVHHSRLVPEPCEWPSLAQIAGHILDAIFIDTLDADLERLQRVNRTIGLIPHESHPDQSLPLRGVQTLVVRPSRPLDDLAAPYVAELPRAVRFMLRRAGALAPNGGRILSYLLFEPGYCRRLVRLGFADARARREEIIAFLRAGLEFHPEG